MEVKGCLFLQFNGRWIDFLSVTALMDLHKGSYSSESGDGDESRWIYICPRVTPERYYCNHPCPLWLRGPREPVWNFWCPCDTEIIRNKVEGQLSKRTTLRASFRASEFIYSSAVLGTLTYFTRGSSADGVYSSVCSFFIFSVFHKYFTCFLWFVSIPATTWPFGHECENRIISTLLFNS